MKIEHIRTFLEIAACGNFNRAAENLNVTQSTVSARVRTMEEQFGRTLFTRSHAGVELTSAGHRFRRYATGMQQLWQQSHQELSLPDGFRSVLSLGAQVSLWERLILKWIPQMRRQLPGVALRVDADYSVSLMRQLSDGLLDIGVMYEPRHAPGLIIEDLFEETLVLVATPNSGKSNKKTGEYVFVDWGNMFRAEHGEAFPDMETPAVSVGLGALGLQYILQNGGSGYFALRMVESLLDQGSLVLVDDAPRVRRPVYVVHTSQARDEEAMTGGLELLRTIALESSDG